MRKNVLVLDTLTVPKQILPHQHEMIPPNKLLFYKQIQADFF